MALRSGLALYCYTAPMAVGQPLVVREYAEQIQNLRFTILQPGGYGQLSAQLLLPDARQYHPEFALFSRVVLVDGPNILWMGEQTDPTIGLRNGQEYVRLDCLGLGSGLRDDPITNSYQNQTVQQMATTEVNARNLVSGTYATAPIDNDTTGLFPDNPSGLYSPSYDGRHMEEKFTDFCLLAGTSTTSYTWWTQATNSGHTDAASFPLLKVWAKLRDTATTTYEASVALQEVEGYEITASGDRAYNAVEIDYLAPTVSGLGVVFVHDARLVNATLAQNTAPFRFRKYRRDLSGISTVTAGIATNIANQYLALYQNPTNKCVIWLRACRDGNGSDVPLYRVAPFNSNIFIPEMTVRGQTLPTAPTAGVNQYYMTQTTYSEDASGAAMLEIQADNFVDRVENQITRLSLAADTILRANQKAAATQATGAPETGACGTSFQASAANQWGGGTCNFKTTMTNVPTSVTVPSGSTLQSNNAQNPTVSSITAVGFHLKVQSIASGLVDYVAYYKTNGNCWLDVDAAKGTFAHHCDECEAQGRVAIRRGLKLKRDLVVHQPGTEGGGVTGTLAVRCPGCGSIEHYTTTLTADDEEESRLGNWAHRANQARLLRQAMRHPHVGLPVR